MKATTDETHTDNKQQETTKGETIKGILFILWFLASIGFMWYFSETGKPVLILALAGQYFLVFGLIGIFFIAKGTGKPLLDFNVPLHRDRTFCVRNQSVAG